MDSKLNILPADSHPGDASDYGTNALQCTGGAFQYVKDLSAGISQVGATGLTYGLMLDAIYKDGGPGGNWRTDRYQQAG